MRRLFLSSLLSIVWCSFAFSQTFSDKDLLLLQRSDFLPESTEFPVRPFLVTGKTLVAKYNPVKLFFSGSMYFYQNVVSVQLNSNCPFRHSCSAFSKLCIAQHGLVKGFLLTGDRLTRCSSFGLRDINLQSDTEKNKIIDEPDFYH